MTYHQCGDNIISPDGLNGEKICGYCGLVIEDAPTIPGYRDWSPEWYSNWGENDSETVMEWLTTLRSVSCQLNIPNFPYREEAARVIRAQRKQLFKSQKLSKNKRATAAAVLHLILKEYDKTRSLKEISRQLSLDSTLLMKQTWLVTRILTPKKEPLTQKRKTAIDYLLQYTGALTTDLQLIVAAESTLAKLKKSGGNPIGLAAGAFYITCKEEGTNITRQAVGEAFHISHRTVYANEAKIRKLLKSKKPKEP